MTKEKAIELVKKLLSLGGSDNEHEAQDAMVKAQSIMLKYHLEQSIVQKAEIESADHMATTIQFTHRSDPWVSVLAALVANNFRCKYYLDRVPGHNNIYIINLIGETDDLKICNLTLKYAYESIISWTQNNKKSKKRMGYSAKEIKYDNNGYALGFVEGLGKMFNEQVQADKKYEIVLQTPQSVLDRIASLNLQTQSRSRIRYTKDNYGAGFEDGRACNVYSRI